MGRLIGGLGELSRGMVGMAGLKGITDAPRGTEEAEGGGDGGVEGGAEGIYAAFVVVDMLHSFTES